MNDQIRDPVACRIDEAFRPCVAVERLRAYGGTVQTALEVRDRKRVAKLDWNESVHPPCPGARRALVDYALGGELNWYPDVEARELRAALADYTGVPSDCIRAFGGSDAALEYIARTFVTDGSEVLWCPPTYDNFRVYVESCGGNLKTARLASIWEPDTAGLLNAMTEKTRLVYLVNPNNPTGTLYSPDQIRHMLATRPDVGFILDEAYYEFAGVTTAPLLCDHRNLMIVRSFSKAFGLAGLRLGYILAHPGVLAWIDRIRVGKNTNGMAQIAALEALKDRRYLKMTIMQVRSEMVRLVEALSGLGIEVRTTPANYLLVRVADPNSVCRLLEDQFIYVRNRHRERGLAGYLRITIGTPEVSQRIHDAFAGMPPELIHGACTPVASLTLQHSPETDESLKPLRCGKTSGVRGRRTSGDSEDHFVDDQSKDEYETAGALSQ